VTLTQGLFFIFNQSKKPLSNNKTTMPSFHVRARLGETPTAKDTI
jgi:hypothetical protein